MLNLTDLDPALSLETQPQAQPDKQVTCNSCGHQVTSRKHACQVLGSHEHTFRNPAGYSFHLLCYQEAAGAIAEGRATSSATWFPDYCWSFSLCQNCHQHLGWHYYGPSDRFVGLIATRLAR